MSSAARTLDLLTLFTAERPELGLSEFCRLAGRDKATTYRHLSVLAEAGFVERDRQSKRYRLGPAILQLAQTREVTVPRKSSALPVLERLADVLGETSHASVLSGPVLYALCACQSSAHSTRAIIDVPTLPLHATASGLCALAFGPEDLFGHASKDMQKFTPNTIQSVADLADAVDGVRRRGFAHSDGSLEQDVRSLATPLFDQANRFAGCVAVAAVASRVTANLESKICQQLVAASREISRHWGGQIPPQLDACWQQLVPSLNAMDRNA